MVSINSSNACDVYSSSLPQPSPHSMMPKNKRPVLAVPTHGTRADHLTLLHTRAVQLILPTSSSVVRMPQRMQQLYTR